MPDFNRYIDELEALGNELQQAADSFGSPDEQESMKRLNDAIHDAHSSWSGSNLGYHSRVYYRDLETPPANDMFSKEWGLMMRSDTPWTPYSEDEVRKMILKRFPEADLDKKVEKSDKVRSFTFEKKDDLSSILSNVLEVASDSYLENLAKTVQDTSAPSTTTFARQYIPAGAQMSRDSTAIDQGLKVAPHQQLSAELQAIEAPYLCARALAKNAKAAAAHLRRRPISEGPTKNEVPMKSAMQLGSRVFIGHGRSPQWRELKEFLQDRLGLQVDEFNRVPVAGTTTVARLSQMMDNAAFACLIMTAEDELADGTTAARANVVHEVGLFQGRLGFERAIVLMEEGCEEFSNITGLSQLRYPEGRISAIYEELRQVLEREGML